MQTKKNIRSQNTAKSGGDDKSSPLRVGQVRELENVICPLPKALDVDIRYLYYTLSTFRGDADSLTYIACNPHTNIRH